MNDKKNVFTVIFHINYFSMTSFSVGTFVYREQGVRVQLLGQSSILILIKKMIFIKLFISFMSDPYSAIKRNVSLNVENVSTEFHLGIFFSRRHSHRYPNTCIFSGLYLTEGRRNQCGYMV